MKPKFANLLLFTTIAVNLSGNSLATEITRADTSGNLNLGTDWVGGVAPGSNDVAVWNSTLATPANATAALGANTSWLGIKILNPSAAVSITAGNTLTLGSGGIDMSSATQGLTIAALATLSDTAQTWKAGNQAINITSFTRGSGSVVNFITSGGGTINIASGTASAALGGYAVLNSSDYAALDGSKNVVAATYADYSAGGSISGTYVGILNITGTTTGSTQAWRNSNSLTVASGIRFGVNNSQNTKWTVDTSSAGRLVTTPSILIGSAVTQDVEFNGLGGVRAASSGGELFLQNFGSGNLIFNTTINGNGTSTLTKGGGGKVVIASASGYTGVTRITDGTFQLGSGGTVGSVGSTSIVNNGNLAFNRTDVFAAGYNISGSGSVTQSGSGTVSLTGTNTYTGATNFNAGTVSFNSLSNFGSGTALNFNGGALLWNGATTDISTRTVTFDTGGGTLNTNGNNVSLANSIGNNGAGGLTKSGAGTLTLNGSTYTGTTTVNGGNLVANGSIAGGATVNSGGTLGGTGSYGGNIVVNTGGIIAPGNSVGTITTAGLTLGTGSVLNFEFNTTPANDRIVVTTSGGLTINGGGFNLYAEGTTNAFSTLGAYNLIGYAGSIGGTGVGALSVLNPQAGKIYTFGATGSDVTLGITAAGVISNWNVDASGSWGGAGNWSATIPNGVGETANFNKALSASRTVTLDGGRTVGAISFDGGASPLGYTIAQGSSGALTLDNGTSQANVIVSSGANAISADVVMNSATSVFSVASGAELAVSGSVGGSGALVKSGSGTLDLTGTSNSYAGNTTVAGGTLGFAGLGSLGGGNLSLDGGTLRYDALNTADISSKTVTLSAGGGTIDTNGNDVTFANAIGNAGSGSLTKTGAGELVLQGANTQTGATSVNGGALSVSSNGNFGDQLTGAAVNLNGGTLHNTATFALDNAGANARNVSIGAGGGTVNADAATTLTVGGTLSGAGALTKSGAGILALNGNNSATFSGALNLNQGIIQLGGAQSNGQQAIGTGAVAFNGGTLRLNGAGAADNATSYGQLNNAISVASGQTGTLVLPKRVTIGSTLTGSGTLNVQIDGTRDDFQGNWGAFSGQLNLTGAGEFRIANFQTSVFTNSKLNIGAGVSVHQTFNPPSSGNLTTVQNIGELSGAAGSSLGGNPVSGRFVEWSVGALNTNSTFSGSIVDDAGAAKLTKVGSGILTLDGTSTYTGATTVTAGTLLVNGALGATAVGVTGGTLGGTGTIGGGVTVSSGAFLSPGASIESLGVASATINGTLLTEYDGTGLGTIDLLSVSGLLDITNATVDFNQLGASLDDPFYIFATYGSLGGTQFSSVVDLPGGYNIDYAYNDGITSTNIALVAVPEPASLLLGSLGLLAMFRRRRN